MNRTKFCALWIAIFGLFASQIGVAIAASPGLVIISPVTGTVLNAGQSLAITVSVLSGTYPNGVAILGPLGATGIKPVVGSTLRFTLAIPVDTTPNSYQLTAVAIDSKGAMVSSAPVTIAVERADLPTALRIDPPSISFSYIGQTLPWTISASFTGQTQTDLTQSRRLTINSGDPRIAIVEQGIVKAMGSGKTTINVRYGSITQSISVTVPAFVRGDLNGDGRVDQSDLNVILSALHTQASGPNDARDLNRDGVIDERDAQILKSLCAHSGCTSQ